MKAILLTLPAVAFALGRYEISIRAENAEIAVPVANSKRVDATISVGHVFNHVLGLPSPLRYDTDPVLEFPSTLSNRDTKQSYFPGLPATDIWKRPETGFFITVEGAGTGIFPSAPYKTFVESDRDRLGYVLERIPMKSSGISSDSIEMVTPAIVYAPHNIDRIPSLRWDDKLGFVAHKGDTKGMSVPSDVLGYLACTEKGRIALTTYGGLVAEDDGKGSCPSYAPKQSAGIERPVKLYPGVDAATGRILSEAALAIIIAQTAADVENAAVAANVPRSVPAGFRMFRLYMTGPVIARKHYGQSSYEFRALLESLRSCITAADSILATAFGAEKTATIVFSGEYTDNRDSDAHPAPLLGKDSAIWPFAHPNAASLMNARNLEAATSPTPAPKSIDAGAAIGNYHVILWTSVILGATLFGVIYVMLGMDDKKDPGLYTQLAETTGKAR